MIIGLGLKKKRDKFWIIAWRTDVWTNKNVRVEFADEQFSES